MAKGGIEISLSGMILVLPLLFIFLFFGVLFLEDVKVSDASVINMGTSCTQSFVTCFKPDASSCAAHFQCGTSLNSPACTVAMPGIPDNLDSSSVDDDRPVCWSPFVNPNFYCDTRDCAFSGSSAFVGSTCTVRKVNPLNPNQVLQDRGKFGNDYCYKCNASNVITGMCGDDGGVYLDNSGNCNGPGTNRFSSICGVISSGCEDKVQGDNCNNVACGVCNSSGQCVNGGPCVANNPSISGLADLSGPPGSTQSDTFTVTNNSRGGCTGSFNLSVTGLPAGWSWTIAPAAVSPGTCAGSNSTVNITPTYCAAEGDYSYTVRAVGTGSYSGKSASSTRNFEVTDLSTLCTMNATPDPIRSGDSSTLSWNITAPGVVSANITSPLGTIAAAVPSGSTNVSPASTTRYEMNLRFSCGWLYDVCSERIDVCAANWGLPCTSPLCGISGTNSCSGVCSATDPADYGDVCQSAENNCEATNSGRVNCTGSCVNPFPGGPAVTPPPDASGCTLSNSCGASVNGFQCLGPGSCTDSSGTPLTAPPDPAYLGAVCQSGANSCGATNSGTKDCADQCVDAVGNPITVPPNPAACTRSNDCGDSNSGFECAGPGSCVDGAGNPVSAPPNPPGFGSACTISNGCNTTNGTLDCDGATCIGPAPAPCPPPPPPTCVTAPNTAGLVPCGKKMNDPATTWDECADCNLCHFFLMGQLIIEFLVRLAGVAAIVAIAIGGLIYAFAAGNSGLIEKAKSIIKYTLIGFAIVFIAWAIVDSVLTATGYIDPMGGEWYSIECD